MTTENAELVEEVAKIGLRDVIDRLAFPDYALFIASLLLLIFARTLIHSLAAEGTRERTLKFRTNAVRGFAVLFFALFGYYHFYHAEQMAHGVVLRILSVMVVVYLSYLIAFVFSEFARNRYGKRYIVNDRERVADTYASRILSIFIAIFVTLVALISVVRILGFDSLLEAGGVIGFIGVFLALTQGAWAPDIISGLIILNSKMFEERDVVKLSDSQGSLLGTVHRTKAFHTELLNIVDNHRVMIRNSRIRDYNVHNLSKFASARGLRETMRFKIGYDVSAKRVRAMFEKAYALAVESEGILLEGQYPLEIRVFETGDHAIEWSIHYYTKHEEDLVKTRQLFRELILEASLEDAISLSTPLTHVSV